MVGKDSTVLLDIARSIYPNISAVFVNTGLEYPEIQKFVRTIDNVTWIYPEMRFDEVIKKYGYPVISKEVSNTVEGAKKNQDSIRYKKLKGTLLDHQGNKSIFNCEKWGFLLDAPFKCSDKCCAIMKKKPVAKYDKETGKVPILRLNGR